MQNTATITKELSSNIFCQKSYIIKDYVRGPKIMLLFLRVTGTPIFDDAPKKKIQYYKWFTEILPRCHAFDANFHCIRLH